MSSLAFGSSAILKTNGESSQSHLSKPRPATPILTGISNGYTTPPLTPSTSSATAIDESANDEDAHFARFYRTGEFSDVDILFILRDGVRTCFKLHSIIIARSPFLASFLRSDASPSRYLELQDPNISVQSLNLALAFLYSANSIIPYVTALNAREVLAIAYYFQIDALCTIATRVGSTQIESLRDAGEFERWFSWMESGLRMSPEMNGNEGYGVPYGRYGRALSDKVSSRLKKLPNELMNEGGEDIKGKSNAMIALIDILASVPFIVFQTSLESTTLTMMSEMERFSLGKKIVAERKKRGKNGNDDEHVVLGFASGTAGVSVLRKPKKRTLWKIHDS